MKLRARPFTIRQKIISIPVAGYISDKTGKTRTVLLVLSSIATVIYVTYLLDLNVPGLFAVVVATSFLTAPLFPLADRLAVGIGERGGIFFGYKRLWGSVGFLGGSLSAGLLVESMGSDSIILVIAGGAIIATSSLLPIKDPSKANDNTQLLSGSPFMRIWSDRFIRMALIAAALTQASNAFFYSMSTVYWLSHGLSAAQVSGFWTVGILAEIAAFLLAPWLLMRVEATKLLMWSAVLTALRWFFMGITESYLILMILQVLQAATIGFSGAAFAAIVGKSLGENEKASAFSVHRVLGNGVFITIASFASTILQKEFAISGFLMMVPFAVLSAVLAYVADCLWIKRTIG